VVNDMTNSRGSISRLPIIMMATSVLLTGCINLKVVTDDADAEPLAHVNGDYHLRAGAAVNVYLRSVDDAPLHFWQHGADIQAGEHRLLVDCSVVSTDKLSRHELKVTLEPGEKYRLTAKATPREGCTQVYLEEAH
jgi:hypothetical protein